MHDECRPGFQTSKAAFERLQSPGLRGVRIAQENRIVELDDLASGRYQRGDFMMNRVGVIEGKLPAIALIVFIRHAVGNGAGPGKADLGDTPGVLLREQKLLQNQRPLVAESCR